MGAASAPRRLAARPRACQHPEFGALAAVAIAWVTLIALFVHSVLGSSTVPGMAGMAAMPVTVMTGPAGLPGALPAASGGLAGWILMCVAMMGPASLPGITHTSLNSLRWRRGRAMAEFSAAYLGVWAVFGVIALSLKASVPSDHGLFMFAALLTLAAAWELTPAKRRALRECHRSVPLPLRGWRAERGSALFGARQGLWCVSSCWCLMLVMLIVPGYDLPWMIVITGLVTTERLAERPLRVVRFAANGLWVTAAVVLNVALNLRAFG